MADLEKGRGLEIAQTPDMGTGKFGGIPFPRWPARARYGVFCAVPGHNTWILLCLRGYSGGYLRISAMGSVALH